MRKLATYSIETDHTVRLDFADGLRLRVPITKLGLYLHAPDRERVERGVKLRRQFISRHMPKVLIGLVAAGLIASAVATPKTLDRLISPPTAPEPAASQSVPARATALRASAAASSSTRRLSPAAQSTRTEHPAQSLHVTAKSAVTKAIQNHSANVTIAQAQTSKPSASPKPKSMRVLPLHVSLPLL